MNRKRERKSIETIYTSHRIEFIYIALFNIVIDMLGEIPEAPPLKLLCMYPGEISSVNHRCGNEKEQEEKNLLEFLTFLHSRRKNRQQLIMQYAK